MQHFVNETFDIFLIENLENDTYSTSEKAKDKR